MSMPDSFEHTPTLAVRMPNGGLASLAGNVDPHHKVAIADLVLAQSSVQSTVTRLIQQLRPRLVGLSVMHVSARHRTADHFARQIPEARRPHRCRWV